MDWTQIESYEKSNGVNKIRFDYVKRHLSCMEYIMRDVKLKKVGMLYQGRCPFHNEKTGSFTVFPAGYNGQEYGSFYCFGCGVGGDVIEYKRLQEGFTTHAEALLVLEQELGIEADDEALKYSLLQEQLSAVRHTESQFLSFTEINLLCSTMCRNHLLWVKEHYLDRYNEEVAIIEKFYRHLDKQLLMLNTDEANNLADEFQEKLLQRKNKLVAGE